MAAPELPRNHRRPVREEEHRVWKFNPVLSVIFILGSALLGWTISLIPDISAIRVTVGLCSGILAAIFLLAYANTRRFAISHRDTLYRLVLTLGQHDCPDRHGHILLQDRIFLYRLGLHCPDFPGSVLFGSPIRAVTIYLYSLETVSRSVIDCG